jgi:hypothetical protein
MTMTIETIMPSALTVTQGAETRGAAAAIKENILNWRMFLTYRVRMAPSVFAYIFLLTDVFTKYM